MIRLQQQSTPATPPAGTNVVFFNASGQLCLLNSAGTVEILDATALFVDQASQTLSAAATQALCTAVAFARLAAKYIFGAGTGAYVVNLTLPVASMLTPAVVELNIELPAGSNPTINIYDTSTGGTLLAMIVNPAPANAAYWFAQFKFGQDAHWHKQFALWNS